MHRVTWSLPDHIWPWALVQTSLFSKSNTEIKYKLNYSRTIKRIKARIMLSVLNWNKSVKNNAPFAKLCLKIMLAQSTNKSSQFEIQLKSVSPQASAAESCSLTSLNKVVFNLVTRVLLLSLPCRWDKDPGCSWSRDHLWHKLFHRGRVSE